MSSPREALTSLGLSLPSVATPQHSYVPVVREGHMAYVSGQVPKVDGRLEISGRVGAEVSLSRAQDAARLCVLNGLAQLELALGKLDAIERVVRLTAYVSSAAGFFEQPEVIDAASDLLVATFGDRGRHARSAIGVAALPGNAPVEIELIVACGS